jgi:uncharacterized protein YkwD
MLKFTRRGFIVLGAAFTLSACGEPVLTTITPAVAATPADMVDAINKVRKANGSKPLVFSPLLADIARSQARAMVAHDEMSHDFGPGGDLRDRATLAGYHGPIGENVAAGQRTLEETLNDWMNSAGHRYTLLSDMWTGVGMAAFSGRPGSKYGIYWAADFGTA